MDELLVLVRAVGASNAAILDAERVVLSEEFREICKGNGCGNYGQCYMCPPDVGEISTLMAEIRCRQTGILYQGIYALEDSFDFEGMQAAGEAFNRMSRIIHQKISEATTAPLLHLAAGGCRSCETCAKRDGQPCRKPDEALPSLEAYGVDVYRTATHAGLQYSNGQNTVTYFGLLLF